MNRKQVALLLAGIVLAGCGAKPEPSAPRPVAAPPPKAAEPVAAPVAPAATQPAVEDKNPDLTALNAAYKKFWLEKKSPPAKLEDLVKANYLKKLPIPPAGKRYSVDWNKMEVSLVNQ